MNENSSGGSATFGFKKPDTDASKQADSVTSPVEGIDVKSGSKPTVSEKKQAEDEDLDKEYTDERYVTVSLVRNFSMFRRANDKVLPKRKDYIGSSINSSRTLASNKEEIETYFPNIVGLSPNNDDFVNRVKQYLNNIKIPVDELGRKFNISFHYYHKRDYNAIKAQEEIIESVYNKANRNNLEDIKNALKEKILRLNVLEGTKCKLGYPVNIEEYIMYRHCLLYNDVAKDVALINSDPNVRFYFKDDNKEAEKLRKFRMEVNKAKANYVTCLGDSELFDAIYIQYCSIIGLPVIASLAEDRIDREIKLDKFSTDEPVKFNAIFTDKDVKLKATIETLIARGELVRYNYNQNIVTPEGEFIGSNLKEAVIWFKDPKNASVANAFYNRLKNI